jgi:glutathione peroxidase
MIKALLTALLVFSIPMSATLNTVYNFKVQDIDGGTIDFHQFKGKKILIVNVASKCGFTPQ